MRSRYIKFLKLLLGIWILLTLIFIFMQPNKTLPAITNDKNKDIANMIDNLESQVKDQANFYLGLRDKLRVLESQKDRIGKKENLMKREMDGQGLNDGPIIPILLIACNREPAVKRALQFLIKYRSNRDRFPIIVSQDCGHKLTKKTILEFEDEVSLIEQPDLSLIDVPLKEKKFRGYFMISRHYKWALNQIFNSFNYDAVIIVEDDLDVASDFYEYFSATYPLLKKDPTLWCVSAWNDNGKKGRIDTESGASTLYRTDFFPGLGWMLTKDTWNELEPKWPKSYWDDWMRAPIQRHDRACIRPEISRTRTFGKKGISNGLFFEKHLKYIHLNTDYVKFTESNLTYLLKENYDSEFDKEVRNSLTVTLPEIKSTRLSESETYKILYDTKDSFKKAAKALGLMDDFKAGVPRTGYKGVVTLFYGNKRIYLAPRNWKGYDPTWS